MSDILATLRTRFATDRVDVAWIGGSATWALPVPECLGVPEGDIIHLSGTPTPWGPMGRYRLIDVDGRPLLRVPVHGWLSAEGRFEPGAEPSLRVFHVLRSLGVRLVIIDASVGGIIPAPGDVLVTSDFVDNHDKPLAYAFAREEGLKASVRLAAPYCPRLRARLAAACREALSDDPAGYAPLSGRVHTEGVYVATPFGVFETAAEIEEYRRAGWAVVGQSAGIETILARLCGMHVAHLCVSANWAEGLHGGAWHGDMAGFYRACTLPMARILWPVVRELALQGLPEGECWCDTIGATSDMSGLPVAEA